MKVLEPGHTYDLDNFQHPKGEFNQTLRFIQKVPNPQNPSELVTIQNGTTNEEVLKALINRTEFLNTKFPCRENSIAITKMQEALMWFEKRTADRLARGVEGKHLK